MKKILIMGAFLLGAASVFAQQKPNYELASHFSAKKVNSMVFSTKVNPNPFEKSDRFWYEWQSTEGTSWYIVDPVKKTQTQVFDLDRLARQITEIIGDPFDAQHLPLQGMKLVDDKKFTFSVKSTLPAPKKDGKEPRKGEKKTFYFEYDIASGTLSECEEEKSEFPRWANMSPDGTIGVFAKGGDIYVMDSLNLHKAAKDEKDSTLVEYRITSDAVKNFAYTTSSYSGDEQLDTTRRTGIYSVLWSPDSKHFTAMKTDMREIKDLWVINSVSQPRPTLETYKYQMPGEPGPKIYLYVFDVNDIKAPVAKQYHINAFKDQDFEVQSAPSVKADMGMKWRSRKWLGDEKGFYAFRKSRDLKRTDLCYIALDADSTKTIVSERLNTYVEERSTKFIKNNTQFIHWSERNGWANLYLYNADGTLVRNLTEGSYHVEDVLAVNEKEGYVVFSACGVNKGENPYQMHTYRVSLSGGPIRQLDMDDMNVDAVVTENGKYYVANYSRVDCGPRSALYDCNGVKLLDLQETDLSLLYAAGYKLPQRFSVKAADGITDLYGVMYKPFDFDSTKTYPIIEYVYPGPQVEANNIAWSKSMLRLERLAQIGFIVITVGNRGGHPNRSKWYHNYGYGNLRDYGLEDQKAAVQRLAARYPFIDESKVGIHGHSGGGFMSTAAILTYPDFYTAAVSCAGNHDNSIYNRWWSEQHHGILEEITEKGDTTFRYSIDKNQDLAKNLKGHLMLVHGDIDNNVHPGNTIRVADALIRANKRFDMLILPGQRHGFGDMDEYFFWRLADYFSEWLLGDSDRDKVDIKELNND